MTETGIGIQNPLFFIGVVENNVDSRLEGRIQVRAFGIHGTVQQVPTEDLPWATIISGAYDPDVPIPPLNSWVFGFFMDGRDAQQPMVLGLIPTQMTQPINPDLYGWGAIPNKNNDTLAKGSRPQDYGQPAQSRLARGENVEETYVLAQEMNRITDVPFAGVKETDNEVSFDEPAPAYNAQYPFNRVIETAGGHSVEIDDTPGAERIMIYHKSGSYTQIDSRGTKVDKSVSDKYEVNDTNHHVYVGGKSIVTIEGDARVLVKGNKIEEITGDYTQLIHGNHMISVGGQMNLNSSDEIQARAGRVRLESNVQDFSIKSAGNILSESASNINLKSESLSIESSDEFNILSKNAKITASGDMDLRGSHIKIGGGSKISLKASTVAADDIVQLANGDSVTPDEASGSQDAQSTDLPEPTSKSVRSTNYKNTSSIGSVGYTSKDEGEGIADPATDLSSDSTAIAPLYDLIGNAEGAGYDTWFGGIQQSDLPGRPITSLTVQEILDYQDSIDSKYISEAVGKYQILEDTLRDIVSAGALEPGERFTPDVQDRAALYLLQRRGLNLYLDGSLSKTAFANNISKEWASFPVASGPKAGYSYYDGIAGNKSRTNISTVLDVLEDIKVRSETGNEGIA